MVLPNVLITPTWMLMFRPEGLVEYKTDVDTFYSKKIHEYMLPQYRKMVYEYCLKNGVACDKMAEVHNWLLTYTGVGL